ncbi:hypothetical protein DIPPA_10651 [Diplonema papillatum]|nr:hypothetical protein DIPPA_10651 [Diplonema papillatum]
MEKKTLRRVAYAWAAVLSLANHQRARRRRGSEEGVRREGGSCAPCGKRPKPPSPGPETGSAKGSGRCTRAGRSSASRSTIVSGAFDYQA